MSVTDPYILVGNGAKFVFSRPHEFDYDIKQIAGALSRLCRFTGHTSEFYSVAQHSVFCSHIVSPEFALEALLHDGSEAFIADLSSPLKGLLPEYTSMEAPIQEAIYDYFGVMTAAGGGKSEFVHHADMVALATEKRDLMPYDDQDWPCLDGIEPHPLPLVPLVPREAEHEFLKRFNEIAQ